MHCAGQKGSGRCFGLCCRGRPKPRADPAVCRCTLVAVARTAEYTPEGFPLLPTEPLRCGCVAAIVLFVPALRASVSLRSLILDGNAIGFVGGREVRQHTECSAVE